MSVRPVCWTLVSLVVAVCWSVVDGFDLRQRQQMADVLAAEQNTRQKRSVMGRQWTRWFNADTPSVGQGDFETTDMIKKSYRICSFGQEVVSSQCRVAGTNETFDVGTAENQSDNLLQPCTASGVICLNVQQQSGHCKDYEVRFLCQDSDNSNIDGLFPSFDYKIYIILIAVPIIVVLLRIFWSCYYKRYLKQRQLRLSRQRGSVGSSLGSSSDEDDESIDAGLANPPPSYTELFGTPRSSVFAISGGYCMAHTKCVHCEQAAMYQRMGGQVNGGFVQEENDDQQQNLQELRVVQTETSGHNVHEYSRTQTTQVTGSETADINDDVFSPNGDTDTAMTASESVPTQNTQDTSSGSTHQSSTPNTTQETAVAQNTQETRGLPSVESHASLQGAAAARSPTTTQPTIPPATHCACPCHSNFRGSVSGMDNYAFHWDSPDFVGSPSYPGMHKPVFFISRNDSVTSFTEPPGYEEALEILKKKQAELHVMHV